MLLPGPEAQQLATYIGWLLHRHARRPGRRRAVRPAGRRRHHGAELVYALFGNVGLVAALFFGLKAAVLAIVLEAVVRIGRRALQEQAAWSRSRRRLRRDLRLRRAVPAHRPRRRR